MIGKQSQKKKYPLVNWADFQWFYANCLLHLCGHSNWMTSICRKIHLIAICSLLNGDIP